MTPTHLARKAIAIPLAVVALAVAPAGASAVADVIKSTNDNQFDKATYYSDAGDLVQFQHTGGGPHNVTSTQVSGGERLFSSATISSGTTPVNGTQSLASGAYPFICTVHPGMAAELVVRGAQPEPSNDFTLGKVKKNKKGKAKVKANVTYTPTGGSPNTEDKKIKLVKR